MLIKLMVDFITSDDLYETKFRSFLTSRAFSTLDFAEAKSESIFLFKKTHTLLAKWAKERDMSVNEAANIFINAILQISGPSSDLISNYGRLPLASPEPQESPSKGDIQ
jgi:hypothetical protein